MPLGPLQEAWVKALESGKYQQGQGRLVTVEDDQEKCCCLGVLCLMENLDKELVQSNAVFRYSFGGGELAGEMFYLPQELVTKYNFYSHRGEAKGGGEAGEGVSLAYMNDKGDSFSQIAARVRENPEWFFSAAV